MKEIPIYTFEQIDPTHGCITRYRFTPDEPLSTYAYNDLNGEVIGVVVERGPIRQCGTFVLKENVTFNIYETRYGALGARFYSPSFNNSYFAGEIVRGDAAKDGFGKYIPLEKS